jgi:hypothetical protein
VIPRDYENGPVELVKNVRHFLHENPAYGVILEKVPSNQDEINTMGSRSFDNPFTRSESLFPDSFTGRAQGGRFHSNLPICCVKESHGSSSVQ